MRILVALLLVCAVSAGLWAALDRPLAAPEWRGALRGVAYNPSGVYTDRQRRDGYPESAIREDLRQLSALTRRIRTYSVDPGLDRVPAIARELGLKVTLGIWLSGDRALNERQIAAAVRAVRENPRAIERVIVGNEVILRGELAPSQLARYIARVRRAIPRGIPVGTAEVWSTWLRHPELAGKSDFVAIHLLPYWEGVKAADAMEYVVNRYETVRQAFPGKPILIAEAGWPSEGRVHKGSVPSAAMEGYFLRQFLTLAAERNYDYFAFEAFDQPWKERQEGAVGAFWGIFDAARAPKFGFTGQLTAFPEWPAFALAAVAGTAGIGILIFALVPAMSLPGCLLLAAAIGLVVSGVLFMFEATSLRYAGWSSAAGALVVVPAGLFTALLLLTEAAEWALALWRVRRRPPIAGALSRAPRVSIHVPTHDEPPSMVMQSLAALSRLDYPDFEVIVLDNNTRDESLWQPVADYCRSLGPRFRFFHFDGVEGYKAGALNRALALTDREAELIAVIDSDYQAAPEWLKAVVPGFSDPQVALIQAPQDYRDAGESAFKALCHDEYAGFFRIGMVERNEHNAIIQHGTMCVIRRAALQRVGGWAQWCITEDTELGLRLLESGCTALYTPVSLGRGLIPDTCAAYKAQRHRWVYGAMQIFKRHAGVLIRGRGTVNGRPAKLTPAQRYHFLAGWLPWFADAMWVVFGACALAWTALMAVAPKRFDVPLAALSCLALATFLLKFAKTISLHRAKSGGGFRGAAAAAVTGLALTYTVGRSVLAGLLTSSRPFLRTPKWEGATPWTRALMPVAAESLMLAACGVAIALTVHAGRVEDPAEMVWVAALAVTAVPYAAAVGVALVAALKPAGRPAPDPAPDAVGPAAFYQRS